MKLRKWIALLLALILTLSLCACGEKPAEKPEEEEEVPVLAKGWYAVLNEDDLVEGYIHSTGKKLAVFDGMGSPVLDETRFSWDSGEEAFVIDGTPAFTLKVSKKATELTVPKKSPLPFDKGTYTLEETVEGTVPAPDVPDNAPAAGPETVEEPGGVSTPEPETEPEPRPEPEPEPVPDLKEPTRRVVMVLREGAPVSAMAEAFKEALLKTGTGFSVDRIFTASAETMQNVWAAGELNADLYVTDDLSFLNALSGILPEDAPVLGLCPDYLGVINGEYKNNVSLFSTVPDFWNTGEMLMALQDSLMEQGGRSPIAILYSRDNEFSVYQADMLTFCLQDSAYDVALYPCRSASEIEESLQHMGDMSLVYIPCGDDLFDRFDMDAETMIPIVESQRLLLAGDFDRLGDCYTAAVAMPDLEWLAGQAAFLASGILSGESGPWEIPMQTISDHVVWCCDAELMNTMELLIPEGFEVAARESGG